ncbi:hypothetical protein AYI68_g684 [Smittium mucronatum]|uniref:Uncharacterized protein n=1 Tax=Smittium mucronatum TaxID=133383 RepID=A0A1R0H7H2_9FUNG|nr:hypothetical protein AYI68_g684 [Smittium mucronatum]
MFSEFLKFLDESSIRSFVRSEIDITPVLQKFREFGPTEEPSVKNIISKLCLLLALTEFLRASYIHLIDYVRIRVKNGILYLVIIVPKENRVGRPVEKPCQINADSDPILCLIQTYTVYKEKISRNFCPTPHAKK